MSKSGYQLAQINIARLRAPLDDPLLADFVGNLDRINALADGSPGFVWRFQTEEGHAANLRPYGDTSIIINFSVWDDQEALREFVYRSDHVAIMRRRREWFAPVKDDSLALWWVPNGHQPSIAEAMTRLDQLTLCGPSPAVFTFREVFPAPAAPAQDDIVDLHYALRCSGGLIDTPRPKDERQGV